MRTRYWVETEMGMDLIGVGGGTNRTHFMKFSSIEQMCIYWGWLLKDVKKYLYYSCPVAVSSFDDGTYIYRDKRILESSEWANGQSPGETRGRLRRHECFLKQLLWEPSPIILPHPKGLALYGTRVRWATPVKPFLAFTHYVLDLE